MHDIKFIKTHPDVFDNSLKKRNLIPVSNELITLYNDYTSMVVKIENFQMERNDLSKKIGILSKEKKIGEVKNLKDRVILLKKEINQINLIIDQKIKLLESKLSNIPNMVDEKVPLGSSEEDNVILKTTKKPKNFNFEIKDHVKIAENLNVLDYNQAIKLSGARFSVLKSDLALLHRALGNFMLDFHTLKNNYVEINVPELVKPSSLFGTGQLPKFEEDLFKVSKNLFLIPTAEVSLTNLYREEIIEESNLPLRFTSLTNCFRSEAGSAGLDTRGLIREHQFSKVELVSVVKPDNSMDELDRMIVCVENILKELDLPYRLIQLCSGDIGFSSSYTIDFEVWMPGQKNFREVSSCSNCKDFQSRRMKMKVKNSSTKSNYFPHTLNGSGLAIGRIIVAIIENYQNEDGSVSIPEVLQKYMGGLKKLEKH